MNEERKTIGELNRCIGETVSLRGWLQGMRSSGKLMFLLLRDGTGSCQCTVEAATEGAFEAAGRLTLESSLCLTGTVRADERAAGGVELAVTALEPIHIAEEYPITRKAHGVDFLLNHRHLWFRSPRQQAILRIRHTVIRAVRRFFDDQDFTLIDTPILVPGAAEGAGTLFPVDYFDEKAFLAQTGQLYLESAAMALGKVYCFGPTFRAEKSKTRRHLTEFWMVEPEVAFYELPQLLDLAEAMILAILEAVLKDHRADLETLGRDVALLERVKAPFPRMTYTEAVTLLRSDETQRRLVEQLEADRLRLDEGERELKELEAQLEQTGKAWKREKLENRIAELRETLRTLRADVQHRPEHLASVASFEWGKDLGGDEETILSKEFDRPVFITEYPRHAKAFYMKTKPGDPRVVLNMDMLAPEGYGEIIGGSQREDRLEALQARMKDEGMDPAPYEWYLDLRRYGSVPHGGFGLGVERTVGWICGLRHVRETIPFPRLMGRLNP